MYILEGAYLRHLRAYNVFSSSGSDAYILHLKGPEYSSGPFGCLDNSFELFCNAGYNTGTNSTATFTDSEGKTLFHSNWGKQLNLEGYSVAWHNHFFVGW